MVRLFNVYYPTRVLVLFGAEALIVCASFLLAAVIRLGADSSLVLGYEYGIYKILAVTGLALFLFYQADLYDPERLPSPGEVYSRLLVGLGVLSILLAALGYFFPSFPLGGGVFLIGLSLLTLSLLVWRSAFSWLIRRPLLREKVYVIGPGNCAKRLVEALRTHPELGMDVLDGAGTEGDESPTREAVAASLAKMARERTVDRVIVGMRDRRGTMPVRELLDLRLSGIMIEDATALLEKISGRIEVEELYPSWLIFSEGFRLSPVPMAVRRLVSLLASLVCLLVLAPLFPLIALAIKLGSAGPVFYRQQRVGKNGIVFTCYKFRTMRSDAEPQGTPTWASDNDPRITIVGRFLRRTRLDETPQLWNVLRGDMGFVGPRPERPEFVEWLSREIPYYHLRHLVRPGLTGWAQTRYGYGSSLEEAREKLKYDLYYIKNVSLSLDLLVVFQTVKIVLLGRGSR
ncbi:MAG: TIGR03013 family PEP-CTERM/XrtA system glycosyltransferase [Acidobacteriia bacterium]|nr:TIGR03013 family PEP-CTERM/XrtA system glycosyltransferase [Terriglobia bacterium]